MNRYTARTQAIFARGLPPTVEDLVQHMPSHLVLAAPRRKDVELLVQRHRQKFKPHEAQATLDPWTHRKKSAGDIVAAIAASVLRNTGVVFS